MIQTNPRNFIFEKVKMTAPERNGFDLSHENKQTCKSGYIYPFELIEALPNDDFQIQTESFIRLQPMLSPTMHRLNAYWHWFFCPNRLTWNYWEEFISRGNGKKLPQNQEYTPPEPVTISLYDMIYCLRPMPDTAQEMTNFIVNFMLIPYYRASSTQDALRRFWIEEDVNARLNVLNQCFPEWKFIRTSDTSSATHAVVFANTPRVATSMGIVDTSIPLFTITIDNSAEEFRVDSDTYGRVTRETATRFDGLTIYETRDVILLSGVIKRLLDIKISVMPFVAYALIYNDYYRDENLITELDEVLDYFKNETGQIIPDTRLRRTRISTLLNIFYRAWEKDYFTTATQMPQKAPDVLIPGTGSGEIVADGVFNLKRSNLPISESDAYVGLAVGLINGDVTDSAPASTNNNRGRVYSSGLKIQDSTGASGTTVADVRRSFALQRWFEKAVRTGTRYIESLKAFFNSDAGDARLQRPEYIGGTFTPVQISDVVQNSATADGSDTPQGNLAGYGIVSDNSEMFSYHSPEHGFVIGCFSILARTSYAQQIPKMFSRETWLDYAWPEFEHIGEQGIQNKELFAAPLTKDILQDPSYFDNDEISNGANRVFGYQSRYAEYKQIPDRFGGAFARSLDFWSLGRIFNNPPTLSEQFVNANISERNFAVQSTDEEFEDSSLDQRRKSVEDVDTDQYVCDFWIDVKKVTSLTLFSEPI